MRTRIAAIVIVGLIATVRGAIAGEADVVDVSMQRSADGTYTFSVTVKHGDAGWDHYANRWQVLAPDDTILGERVLLHPHDTEQPFTRSLSGVVIPEGIDEVTIRAGDTVHEFGGEEFRVSVPAASDALLP
jgi:hypothetical protein